MPAPVVAGRSFVAGIRSELLGTYRRMYESNKERLGRVMRLDIPATRRTETFFFWQSAPHMVRWPYGETVPEGGFKGIQFTVTNHRWAKSIAWQADDRSDDQTNSLLSHARGLGQSAALLPERWFFQVLLGTTDNDLLPSIPNAPDGQSLFSTTRDGTNARFGATNGNLLTGTGTTANAFDEEVMRNDYFTAREQFRLFQDTEGQPLLNDAEVDGPAIIIIAADEESTSAQAFRRSLIPVAAGSGGAGVTNETQAAGKTPDIWPTQRVTGNNLYIGLTSVSNKGVFSTSREPLSEVMAMKQNSDIARKQDEESIQWKRRDGVGVGEPYALIEVTEV